MDHFVSREKFLWIYALFMFVGRQNIQIWVFYTDENEIIEYVPLGIRGSERKGRGSFLGAG